MLFPKIYNRINQFGIKNKSDFELAFSLYKLGKQARSDQRGKSKELMDKKTAEKKAELKRRPDENTEKMEMIKKMKKNTVGK